MTYSEVLKYCSSVCTMRIISEYPRIIILLYTVVDKIDNYVRVVKIDNLMIKKKKGLYKLMFYDII